MAKQQRKRGTTGGKTLKTIGRPMENDLDYATFFFPNIFDFPEPDRTSNQANRSMHYLNQTWYAMQDGQTATLKNGIFYWAQ